ncbi:MAG: F-box/leucine-rich repeat protein 14 [Verrucomicrobiales bacterium]|jgi:F-box/leucine-rich repeat protein 14
MRLLFLFLLSLSLVYGDEYVHEAGQLLSGKDFEILCQNEALTRLDLRGVGLVDKDMSHLVSLPGLEELRLDSHRLTPEGYAVLSSLPALKILGVQNTSGNELARIFETIRDLRLVELDLSNCREFTGVGLSELNHKSSLRKLDLSCDRGLINDKGLQELRGFTELIQLELAGHDKIKKGVVHLEEMTKLESLNLYGCVGIEDKEANSLFSKLTNLQRLNMGFCWWHIGDGLVFPESLTDLNLVESKRLSDAAFVEFPCRDSLLRLNLFQCLELTDQAVASFADLTQLESLNLGCIRALTNEALKSIRGNTGLTELVICDNDNFDDSGLAHLAGMKKLEVLNLWHTKGVTGSGFKHLAAMTELVELNLADCYFLEDEFFSELGALESLRVLNLDNCRSIGDAAISKLTQLEKLEELTIPGCERLTDQALLQLAAMQSLRYLDVSSCAGFSDEGIRGLVKALPKCEIVRSQ